MTELTATDECFNPLDIPCDKITAGRISSACPFFFEAVSCDAGCTYRNKKKDKKPSETVEQMRIAQIHGKNYFHLPLVTYPRLDAKLLNGWY